MKKHRTRKTAPDAREAVPIRSRPPGQGHRHVVTRTQMARFLGLIPEWHDLLDHLSAIIIDRARGSCQGFYRCDARTLHLVAWPAKLHELWDAGFVLDHETTLELLQVECVPAGPDDYLCKFTEAKARAFLLLHVFMHEMGHHKHNLRRGIMGGDRSERLAERHALGNEAHLFERYVQAFGDPRLEES